MNKIILILVTFMIGCFANAQPTVEQNFKERCVSGEETHFSAKFKAPNSADELVTIYRGTDLGSEIGIFRESGAVFSDAGRVAYQSTRGAGGSIDNALTAAQRASSSAHTKQLSVWGNLDDYVQAHGAFGQEISVFGPRSLISFTTDPNVARGFGSEIFKFQVPRSGIIPQTLPCAGEAEVLIRNFIK